VGGLKSRLLLRGLVPLLLMAGALVLSLVYYMIMHGCAGITGSPEGTSASLVKSLKAAVLYALPFLIFIAFCLVQSVSAGVFSAWDCIEFQLDSTSGVTKAFLRGDLSIECESDMHTQMQNLSYAFFAVWPVGMPVFFLLVLLASREAIVKKCSTPLTHATSFLHQEFRGRFFWWEVCARQSNSGPDILAAALLTFCVRCSPRAAALSAPASDGHRLRYDVLSGGRCHSTRHIWTDGDCDIYGHAAHLPTVQTN
jgi:hypothetical protein